LPADPPAATSLSEQNAVALEFVLNIDEVLFASLAPARLRQLYGAVRPLALPSVRTWRGLDLRALLTAAAVFSTLAVAYTSVLVPQRDLLVSARDALCAGDRDFVYTRDGLGAVAWAYPDRVDASELHKRNFPDGRPPPVNVATMANEAVTDNKESFAVSTIDNLLRQSGRAPFAEACDNDVCYIPSELSLIDKPGRPDCCFAIKTKVPMYVEIEPTAHKMHAHAHEIHMRVSHGCCCCHAAVLLTS
jgi:hypothetical protein